MIKRTRLTDHTKALINQMVREGITQAEIARQTGASQITVSRMSRAATGTKQKSGPKGVAPEIRRRIRLGHRNIDIARDLNVADTSVSNIRSAMRRAGETA